MASARRSPGRTGAAINGHTDVAATADVVEAGGGDTGSSDSGGGTPNSLPALLEDLYNFFSDLFGGGGQSLPPNYFVFKARVERARRHPQYPKIDHIPNGIVLSQDSSARVKFGKASYYNLPGKTTSSGEPFNANEMTAAMRDVPLGTRVTVKYLPSGSNIYRAVNVTVNDHGPYVGGRIIDLTPAAFAALTNGHLDLGVVPVGVIIPAEPEPPLTEER